MRQGPAPGNSKARPDSQFNSVIKKSRLSACPTYYPAFRSEPRKWLNKKRDRTLARTYWYSPPDFSTLEFHEILTSRATAIPPRKRNTVCEREAHTTGFIAKRQGRMWSFPHYNHDLPAPTLKHSTRSLPRALNPHQTGKWIHYLRSLFQTHQATAHACAYAPCDRPDHCQQESAFRR